jgi:hypothetical protein
MFLTSIIINALIFNLTNQTLQLQYCDNTVGYFVRPMSANGFITVSYVLNSGDCYFLIGDKIPIKIIWYYNTQIQREYYGIFHDANVDAWIQIAGSGKPRYYLY